MLLFLELIVSIKVDSSQFVVYKTSDCIYKALFHLLLILLELTQKNSWLS